MNIRPVLRSSLLQESLAHYRCQANTSSLGPWVCLHAPVKHNAPNQACLTSPSPLMFVSNSSETNAIPKPSLILAGKEIIEEASQIEAKLMLDLSKCSKA